MTAAAPVARLPPEQAGALMRRATAASVAVGGTMVAATFLAWLASGSVSLLSSLLDSLLDAAAALVNLWAVRHAFAPADREHRFGHGKAEPLASLGQAAFIAGSALFLLFEALQRLLRPVEVTNIDLGVAVMVLGIVTAVALVSYERHVVRRTGSLIIGADALHYRAHLVVNASVIVSLLLTRGPGWRTADPICGAAIGIWIVFGAWQMARQSVTQLMDRELPDAERAQIRNIALSDPAVRAVHDLRTRAAGPNAFIQIHLEMDGAMTLAEAHRISDDVEAKLRAAFPYADVLIHQDPEGVEEPRASFGTEA
ncbi:MAG TPA: cation diffusion facilitator family transporter [Stellaceae bacterium]|nr:cation diffusion facilitator family transporter [Stellaceae bacterium]